jgi:superfamily II DNA or RNA helicase
VRLYLNAVRDGNVDVLVATTPADEGLDPPPFRSLIVALGGESRIRALQRIGGLARPYPGKDVAIVFDTWDSAEFLHKQASQEEAA